MGWSSSAGLVYAREYAWDERSKRLLPRSSPRSCATWTRAESAAGLPNETTECRLGVLREKSTRVAQLRLLLVAPEARRPAIGRRLVEECIQFARSVGISQIMFCGERRARFGPAHLREQPVSTWSTKSVITVLVTTCRPELELTVRGRDT